MAELEATLFPIVSTINTYLSNYILVFLLIGVGLWYSIRTRFVQIRCFGEGMKRVFGNLSLSGGRQEQGGQDHGAGQEAVLHRVSPLYVVSAYGTRMSISSRVRGRW